MADNNDSISMLVCVVVLCFLADSAWHSKFRYSVQYHVPISSVTKLEKPSDCDFLTAPIGNKGCHYEPEVATVRTGHNAAGERFVSYDDGKTWTPNDSIPAIKAGVFVSWNKITGGD